MGEFRSRWNNQQPVRFLSVTRSTSSAETYKTTEQALVAKSAEHSSVAPVEGPRGPRIYYVHPLVIGRGLDGWNDVFEHATALNFDTVLTAPIFSVGASGNVFATARYDQTHPALGLAADPTEALDELTSQARRHGLDFMTDVVLDRMAAPPTGRRAEIVDPRLSPDLRDTVAIDLAGEGGQEQLALWSERLANWAEAGVNGFRVIASRGISAVGWIGLLDTVRGSAPPTRFYAWTPGTSFEARRAMAGVGFDGAFSSIAWWNGHEPWLVDEHNIHRAIGSDIAFPEAPFSKRVVHGSEGAEIIGRKAIQALEIASAFGDGVLVPMGFEFGVSDPLDPAYGDGGGLAGLREKGRLDLSAAVLAANRRLEATAAKFARHPVRIVGGTTTKISTILKVDAPDIRRAREVRLIAVNRDLRKSASIPSSVAAGAVGRFLPLRSARGSLEGTAAPRLAPGEVRLFDGTVSAPVSRSPRNSVGDAVAAPRLMIEKVTPSVDHGRFPVKRVVGQTVRVEADIFGDGHDPLSVALLWRAVDEREWRETPMELVVNDRWAGEFRTGRLGGHEFTVEVWRDPFKIFRYELVKKNDAGLDLNLEAREGILLVQDAADASSRELSKALRLLLDRLKSADDAGRVAILLEAETARLMALADRRPFATRHPPLPLEAERQGAAFASWYELFPRSQSGDPSRHGTFDDVVGRMKAIRDMGFDVIYFPPIHPIGLTNRKGRNNSLTTLPEDPGSPYAIGSAEGGHEAIHPELGTVEDFRRMMEAAADHGLEVALDLAIQASPDHPWLKDHPGWFDWRPDGTIRYAENPPKKYEDIVNLDFYAARAKRSLWLTLRNIVELWVDRGVNLFRVDNPHTKPFPFWEWLISDIRSRHPDVVFLSEAFTRPKVMYDLAKIGFSQSYTYFTWRNAKWELEQYMLELTTSEAKEFFRPHFFVNTHDINPDFLQDAPRQAYMIRAALAATLSGLWGIYNGFELCEGRPDAKRKEYADSEKYEIRAWDWDRPGNIIAEIALLNRIRRDNQALHSHLGLTLLNAWNDNILYFEKATPDRENVVLVAISLDPHAVQEADIEIPLWSWNLPDHGHLAVEDLVRGNRLTWIGKRQHIRLDPGELPFSIWRIGPTEA